MPKEPFGRLDANEAIRAQLLPYCRLKQGEIWHDPEGKHRVGVLDATHTDHIHLLFAERKAALAIHDPPYNVTVGNANTPHLFQKDLADYMQFSETWMQNAISILEDNASLYVWLGADQNAHFQPFADFILMMRQFETLQSRSFITLRNQRGYGTAYNWMAVRQECLYYTQGKPFFDVNAEYTDIPKILRGYYKNVRGEKMDNVQRGKSPNIRAGNVWVDVQQVFYRMEENVAGCYAQKPLKAIERLIQASSQENDLITDFFAHAGTTLLAGEKLNRNVFTLDLDPVFAEITIRRLEHFRKTGKTGWQYGNPFPEIQQQ